MFLEEFYKSDDQTYLLLSYANNLCEKGKFDELAVFIENLDILKIDTAAIRMLCIIMCWHQDLRDSRALQSCWNRMIELRGDKITQRLLWFIKDLVAV